MLIIDKGKNSMAELDKDVSVNVVSAYFHDHLFVPVDRAGEAMTILNTLSETASNQEKYHERKILP